MSTSEMLSACRNELLLTVLGLISIIALLFRDKIDIWKAIFCACILWLVAAPNFFISGMMYGAGKKNEHGLRDYAPGRYEFCIDRNGNAQPMRTPKGEALRTPCDY